MENKAINLKMINGVKYVNGVPDHYVIDNTGCRILYSEWLEERAANANW